MGEAKTTIDYLKFRAKVGPEIAVEAMRPMYGDMGSALRLVGYGRGKDGFLYGATLALGDMGIGRVDHGGASQRGWLRVTVPGQGCEWVQDWTALEEVEGLQDAELRRTDIALTTWQGEVSHERVVAAYEAGRFTQRGRPPVMTQVLKSEKRAGRTCYVGNRKADKFFRAYEKGLKWASESGGRQTTHVDGFPVEGIYRCEVELKAETRPIPFDVIERRDQYFAGSYPFCADVLPGVEADILQRRPERAPQRALEAVLANCRDAYGRSLFTALHAYGGDIGAVMARIVGDGHNRNLVEAGVLLVDHD